MSSLFTDVRTRDAMDKITLGIVQSLEQRDGVTDVHIMDCKPADINLITQWEQRHMCRLPEDLRNFYLTMDGLLIQWTVKFNDSMLQLGRIEVNPVASLSLLGKERTSHSSDIPSVLDLDSEEDEVDKDGRIIPHFDQRHRVFELDGCDGNGKVCLVYKDIKAGFTTCKPEIWFLDCSLSWYFLAGDFITYFRMMMVHLGLPCWQYLFTDTGLGPESVEWFNLYAPERLSCHRRGVNGEREEVDRPSSSCSSKSSNNKLDTLRVFKGRSERKKTATEQNKSKTPSSKQRATSSRQSSKSHLKSPPR